LSYRITQIENGLLQLERQNERVFKLIEKKYPSYYSKSDLDVLSFGMVLYEMAFGTAFNTLNQIEELPANTPTELTNV
jgi:hypothetical protein